MDGNERYWTKRRRRVSRRRFLVGGGVAAAGSAALLAGCGSDPQAPVATETPTAPAPSEAAAPATPTKSPTATPTPTPMPTPDPNTPRRGGTLRLWKREEDAGLDPGIYHVNNRDVIFPTMTQPLTYQPTKHLFAMDGMVGYEQVSPTTLVWSLRPGMTFHNGDPVGSEAAAFSFGRLEKLYRALDGTHTTRAGYAFVDRFEAPDALTMVERWSRPDADALVHRARHYYSFLNPRIVEEHGKVEGSYEHPDGTVEEVLSVQDLPFGAGSGPYTMTKRDPEGTRVERWPDYFRHAPTDDGFVEDGPWIDAWETRILPDRDAAKQAFIAGELDVFDVIDAEEIPEFAGLDHVSVTEIPNGGFSLLGMDGAKFHDRRARLALRAAIDYEGFIKAVRPFGGEYAAPISPLLPHFQKLTQGELRGWYRHDPKEARALWEAAGVDLGDELLRVLQSDDESSRQFPISEFVARSLHEVLGIRSEVGGSLTYTHGRCGPGFTSLVGFGSPLMGSCDREAEEPWDLLSYGSGEAGGTSGLPSDSHLIHYDPRAYGGRPFNFDAESPHPEIAADSAELTSMLEAQQQELDFDARVYLLTDIQRWILDRQWCNWALPVSSVSHYGFSSRLRDHAPEEWLNSYSLRRESMWLAEG